ncbi:glycoside hydrolase family 5 protein [Pleurotus eryngii]|uniref:glucan 1,3-beta-glucosidase n=1 Tax=Pleurotus eryngii TaxID=5323 RepID=A0A9P5ZWE5_PLEER|nr:glycoside hydrolase family 5 protein [Pleurotus eryngii]
MADGELFIYSNSYGGDWATNPGDPFAPGGKAQSWSRRVGSEEWAWGTDVIRGVNLGGWLVTEPFIVPALYEKYATVGGFAVIDEWMLCVAMGNNVAKELENHYATFITERDFAEIAAAGLNWVRIPIGFWAIDTMEHEPFLKSTSWTYFLKAIEWARKYGLRIYLDLHALPGSQNGWNHSGKGGSINFMNGVMGIANAQRTLTYIQILTEFVSQEQYRDVVCMLGIVNEIMWKTIGQTSIESFYYAAYDTIRNATGLGTGNGPYIALHDAFQGVICARNLTHVFATPTPSSFLSGSDRVVIDQHPVFVSKLISLFSIWLSGKIVHSLSEWAMATNRSSRVFGVTVGGEFSTAINDCGLWLNGVGSSPTSTDCAHWDDWEHYDQATIDDLKKVTLASMDALQNFFFWTWKIGNSTDLRKSSSPLWHYKLGLQRGWIPKDPREAVGHCASVLRASDVFDGRHPATAIGGATGTLSANQARAFPPATLSPSFSGTQMTLLPTYTATGTVKTLFAPTFSSAPSATVGTGWTNAKDQVLAYVPVEGCDYPNAWDSVNASLANTRCTGTKP